MLKRAVARASTGASAVFWPQGDVNSSPLLRPPNPWRPWRHVAHLASPPLPRVTPEGRKPPRPEVGRRSRHTTLRPSPRTKAHPRPPPSRGVRPRPAPAAPRRGAHQRSVHPSIHTLTSLGTLHPASLDWCAAAGAHPRGLFGPSRPAPSSTERQAHHGGPPAAPALRAPRETAPSRHGERGRDQAFAWPRCPSSPLPSADASARPPAPPPPWNHAQRAGPPRTATHVPQLRRLRPDLSARRRQRLNQPRQPRGTRRCTVPTIALRHQPLRRAATRLQLLPPSVSRPAPTLVPSARRAGPRSPTSTPARAFTATASPLPSPATGRAQTDAMGKLAHSIGHDRARSIGPGSIARCVRHHDRLGDASPRCPHPRGSSGLGPPHAWRVPTGTATSQSVQAIAPAPSAGRQRRQGVTCPHRDLQLRAETTCHNVMADVSIGQPTSPTGLPEHRQRHGSAARKRSVRFISSRSRASRRATRGPGGCRCFGAAPTVAQLPVTTAETADAHGPRT